MNTSNLPHAATSHGATSVVSLIAITAGTVSAALLIMFVGLFLTMMSMGSTAQTTASMTGPHINHATVRVAVSSDAMAMHGIQRTQKHQKGHFMDALLRDEGNHSTISSEHQVQPAARMARIYAISATPKFSLHDPHLVQI